MAPSSGPPISLFLPLNGALSELFCLVKPNVGADLCVRPPAAPADRDVRHYARIDRSTAYNQPGAAAIFQADSTSALEQTSPK